MDDEHARRLLARERDRLERLIAGRGQDEGEREVADDSSSLNRAAGLWQDEFDEGRVDDLREQLAAVARAEARVEAGSYGRSILSGDPIPDARLELQPAAEYTVDEERGRRD